MMNAKTTFRLIMFCSLLFLTACNGLPPGNRVVILQPFADFPGNVSRQEFNRLKKIFPGATMKPPIKLPQRAWYQPRQRYRADSIIGWLDNFKGADTVVIGLTGKDISTSKGNIADWGVMGLGLCPGNSCVVSTFRLSKSRLSDQLFKIMLHELGHTQGLPHCPNKTCLMRDAEGGTHLDEESGFCPKCKAFLESKGWMLK